MTIASEKVRDGKAALKGMPKKARTRMTKAAFVESLIKEIHEKMKDGFTIENICEELNKLLSESEQIKISTFRAYITKARGAAGIAPTRASTKRKKTGPAENRTNTPKDKNKNKSISILKNIDKTDFRDQEGEL